MFPSEVIIVPAVFFAFFMVIRTLSNNNVRRKIIERGLSEEQIKGVFAEMNDKVDISFAPMKFGLISLVMGLSLIIIQSFNLYDEYAAAVVFIAVGLVLIAFPQIEKAMKNK